ncbi:MAG: hypothetical protein J6X18_05760 [Bacteroidales bacterium]|nr:hypothetical protein [Bacteroidales bacterium]
MKLFPSIFLSFLLPLAVAAQNVQIQDGAICAEFSVSDSTKVHFSQGNLQYQASTNTWRFAEHQFDIVGFDNENISEKYTGWIDLFGFGTSGYKGRMPYMTSTIYADYIIAKSEFPYRRNYNPNLGIDFVDLDNGNGQKYDWGWGFCLSDGGMEQYIEGCCWRTLTRSEWNYLISERKKAEKKIGNARVNGVYGLVLLPDKWKTPQGLVFKHSNPNEYSESEWEQMEANGAVFLPAAGSRNGNFLPPGDAFGRFFGGAYWSSTIAEFKYSYALWFDEDEYDYGRVPMSIGLSVRLVQNVKK